MPDLKPIQSAGLTRSTKHTQMHGDPTRTARTNWSVRIWLSKTFTFMAVCKPLSHCFFFYSFSSSVSSICCFAVQFSCCGCPMSGGLVLLRGVHLRISGGLQTITHESNWNAAATGRPDKIAGSVFRIEHEQAMLWMIGSSQPQLGACLGFEWAMLCELLWFIYVFILHRFTSFVLAWKCLYRKSHMAMRGRIVWRFSIPLPFICVHIWKCHFLAFSFNNLKWIIQLVDSFLGRQFRRNVISFGESMQNHLPIKLPFIRDRNHQVPS